MKSILLSLTLVIGLLLNSLYSNSQIIISSNTTWSGTQFLSSSVVIQPGAKLTIEAGTLVYFGYVDANGDNIGDVQIEVNGKLVVKGTAACSPVVFRPYTVTTNKKYWKGIKINSTVSNDSLFGAHIYNAEMPFDVLSQATIRDCKIRQFDNVGINFTPTNSSVNLLVQSTSIKSGKTAILQSSATSILNADWVIIDSCTNGIIGNTGSLFLESSLVQNSTRLGVSFKDGAMNISNSRIKKNYVFGVFNVSGDLNVNHCDIDSNSFGGVLMAGVGVNNLHNSNFRNNIGSQVEITEYGFNIIGEFYSSYFDGVPTITANNNNILGDTLSFISDPYGLFNLPGGAGGCWQSQISNCSFSNNCQTAGGAVSSPVMYTTALGKLDAFWVSFGANMSINILTRCFTLSMRDATNGSNIGGTTLCAGPGQYLGTCFNSIADGGTMDITPTNSRNKYLLASSVGTANFGVNSTNNVAFYRFGGDLIFNNIGTPVSPFNFLNNNFGSSSPINSFYDLSNQNIQYSGFTIFPILTAGISFGSNSINSSNFPIAYLQTTSGSNTSCGDGSFNLIAPQILNATYNWYLNGNLFAVNSSNQYSPLVGGQWHCVVTAGICSIKTTVRNITISQGPSIAVSGTFTICQGQATQINVSGGVSYNWSNGGTSTSQIFSPNVTTTYSVTGTNNGCSSTQSFQITVNPLPNVSISPYPSAVVCSGSSVLLSSSQASLYLWSNGASTQTINVTNPGVYNVTITDSNGCSATSNNTTVISLNGPSAVITNFGSTTLCLGGSLVLNANTGTGLTYQWKLNGTNITGATTSTYTANTSGSYTVTVTNTNGCSTTSTATVVTVNALPTATITPANSTTFCQGGNVVLNANTGTGLSYQWRLNGTNITGATSSSYTANASGSYTVVVTNAATCSATSNATVVTINALPTATITPASATTFCQGGSVVLNANNGTGLSYQWYNNASAISGATSATYTANASGSYTVVVTNASTCSATSTATVVTVNALPTATITPATATTFCQGGSVVLNANTGTGLSYQWYNNASAISGATSSSYTANASGSYTVVVTNASTCSATSTATVVNVNALPTAIITPATATTFCQGGSVVLNANTGTGLSYQWYNNASASIGATTSSYTANASGSYTVVVTNASACSSTSAATVVTVNALPTAMITPATATTFCQGGSVVLNANTGTGLTYQWYNNASAISGATGASYTSNASGSYTVMVTNTSSCFATTASVNVLVNSNTTYFADTDNDGYGNSGNPLSTCVQPSGYVLNSLDCNDAIAAINPAASEVCNSIDDNCNSQTDEGLTFTLYYSDTDNDGFGAGTSTSLCSNPGAGYSNNALDCNNSNSSINPSATELCNSVDDNCNSQIDEGLLFQNYYQDFDGDGFGAGSASSLCASQAGYVNNAFDCNDFQAQINPVAQETCNGIDDNCNTLVDDGLQFSNYFLDGDLDGFGSGSPQSLCNNPGNGYSLVNTDCNDAIAAINPTATEICNSIDDNCNLQIDEGLVFTNYFADNDGDGFGSPAQAFPSCVPMNGMVTNNGDCNDANANINPDAIEIGGNGIDENCDGQIDNSIFELNATISLYPNPTRSELNIQVNSSIIGSDLYIFDAVGEQIHKQQILSTNTSLSVETFANGNYIVRIGEAVKRFVVQK